MNALHTFTDQELTRVRASDYIRFLSCLHETRDGAGFWKSDDMFAIRRAGDLFLRRWPSSIHRDLVEKAMDLSLYQRAAVDPGTPSDVGWVPIAPLKPLEDGFLALSRPQSVLGKLESLGSRRGPFNVSIPVQTAGASYAWVGAAGPKPVSDLRFSSMTLGVTKAAGIVVTSAELMRVTTPAAVEMLRRDLSAGLNVFLDQQFTDPAIAAVANVSPGSITNTAPSFGSSGTSAASALADFKTGMAQYLAQNPNAENVVVITSPSMAVALAIAANSETLTARGGTLSGATVITGSVGNRLIFVDPAALVIADDNGIAISTSTQGTVEMQTTATSPVTASVIALSLWQNSLVGIRVERFLNYRARAQSVLFTNIAWA